jgi:hypothetical protein
MADWNRIDLLESVLVILCAHFEPPIGATALLRISARLAIDKDANIIVQYTLNAERSRTMVL